MSGPVAAEPTPPPAAGAKRPSIAPAPSWALPAEIPEASPASEGAASVNLLLDHQVKFGGEESASYWDLATKITSPQGLSSAALQLDWDPSLEQLILHRYRIIRAGQIIDLLGDGSKLSIVQREENMDDAALDGRLTASLQPSDLRVGDVVEQSFTRIRRDPALGGHSEQLTGPNDGATYGRLRTRIIWPVGTKLQWRALPGVLQPKLTHTALGNELVSDLQDVRTPLVPRAAPARFLAINAVELSDFADWRAVAQTILPFYTKAATLAPNSELKVQAQRIAATTSDPRRRAELALALVQDQTRYLFLGMDDGGYIPAAADLTWSRRFGDCKGKTVLLIALLHELGITAEPVLVNTEQGDFVRTRLPALGSFDHVIVRATIAGQSYWLDGTRLGDTRLDLLRTPAYHVGLPLSSGSTGLIDLVPEPLTAPSETIALSLDATAGIDAPAPASGEMRFRGMSGTDMRVKYAGYAAADLDQKLRELWRKNYDFVTPATIKTATDPKTGDFVITMAGTAKLDWYSDVGTRWYELDKARLGWKFDTDRTGAINRDAPFEIDYPDYWESRETIRLPQGGKGFTLQGGPVDQTIQGIYAMHRDVTLANGVVELQTSTRALRPELPAVQAEQAKTELAALSNKSVFVRVPEDYSATAADIGGLQDNKVALAEALMKRGAVKSDAGDHRGAIADEDAAIAAQPSLAIAHSIRALSLALSDDPRATAAVDAALALDPKQKLAWRARSIVAARHKDWAGSEAALTHLLDLDADDVSALTSRSGARLVLGNYAPALADADAAIAKSDHPGSTLRLARAAALTELGRTDEGLAEADRAVAIDPADVTSRQARAELRVAAGKRDLALEDLDLLVKSAPSAQRYLLRSALWTEDQKAKRDADVAAALKLEPSSKQALAAHAGVAIERSDFATAQADLARLEQAGANQDYAYTVRLQLLAKQGHRAEAVDLVSAYLAKHPGNAIVLNERCWTKATLNYQVETALADCNAALKLIPNSPAALDSRAFVELRLGHYAAAIADYDAALKSSPGQAASLYGRAIAKARQGDAAGAQADLAATRALKTNIESRFHDYGIEVPAALAGPTQTASATVTSS